MSYYLGRTLPIAFDKVVARTMEALKKEGFGVLTEIDVKETLKKKIGVDFPNYKILGACNPALAYEALKLENKVGTMLPCNVVVRDAGNGQTEVAAVDPVASMLAIDNPELKRAAEQVRAKLERVVAELWSAKQHHELQRISLTRYHRRSEDRVDAGRSHLGSRHANAAP